MFRPWALSCGGQHASGAGRRPYPKPVPLNDRNKPSQSRVTPDFSFFCEAGRQRNRIASGPAAARSRPPFPRCTALQSGLRGRFHRHVFDRTPFHPASHGAGGPRCRRSRPARAPAGVAEVPAAGRRVSQPGFLSDAGLSADDLHGRDHRLRFLASFRVQPDLPGHPHADGLAVQRRC